jgi:hypothetical protein
VESGSFVSFIVSVMATNTQRHVVAPWIDTAGIMNLSPVASRSAASNALVLYSSTSYFADIGVPSIVVVVFNWNSRRSASGMTIALAIWFAGIRGHSMISPIFQEEYSMSMSVVPRKSSRSSLLR